MMIKAGQILSFNKELDNTRNRSLQELIQRQDIREFVEKNHLTKKALEDAWVDLLAYVDDHEPCLHCHGINECPKMNKGQQITLSYETYVHRDVKSCQYGLEKHENDQLLSRFHYNNMSTRLALTNINDISNKEIKNKKNYILTRKLIDYVNNPQTKGFLVCGGPIRTKLMAGMMNELARCGYEVGLCHVPTLMADVKASFNSNEDTSLVDLVKNIPYLLLDSVGEENVTNWSRDEVLAMILDYRILNELPTFMTSAYGFEDLETIYTNKYNDKREQLRAKNIVSKMKALCCEIIID